MFLIYRMIPSMIHTFCAVIDVCSAKGISDDGHPCFCRWPLAAIPKWGLDASLSRSGCMFQMQMRMHWARNAGGPEICETGLNCPLVHLALCVLKWKRGIKVINTFRPNHSSKVEPARKLVFSVTVNPLNMFNTFWRIQMPIYLVFSTQHKLIEHYALENIWQIFGRFVSSRSFTPLKWNWMHWYECRPLGNTDIYTSDEQTNWVFYGENKPFVLSY